MSNDCYQVRSLNDAFRNSLQGGSIVMTPGVFSLAPHEQTTLLERIQTFDDFSPDNDPHGEHDFASINLAGQRFFWKIDCYDQSMVHASPDPTDPSQTCRVLTIMRADEY